MEHNQQRIQSLLQKYLGNRCSPDEIEELFDYIKKNPDDPIFEQSIETETNIAMESSQDPLPEEVSNSMLTSLQSRIELLPHKNKSFRFNSRTFLQLAAVFILVFFCASYFYLKINQHELIEVRTRYGETKTVALPDKSLIILNGNSSISYDSRLAENEIREVNLKGEAFFKVKHTLSKQKFRVHSHNAAKIEVLGTEFTVNNRRNAMKVALHSGKIKLALENDKTPLHLVMEPGDLVEVTPEKQVIKSKEDPRISWRNNRVVFQEAPLQDILFLLEDNYGIIPVIKDQIILQETFTATYPADNINVLLKALSRSFDITIDGSGDNKKIIVGK